MAAMGSKPAARAAMLAAGVPIAPGGDAETAEQARATAARLGYPVLVKAAFGGGGRGMRLVHREDEMQSAFERAKSEAAQAFGNATVYLEKAIEKPRHVEIQVLGDRQGGMVHLYERDCSIQRRHQKVIEETPCPIATPDLIRKMGEVAVKGALAVGYFSAGTFEFLVGQGGRPSHLLEMNTRLQVEHPITEWTTGVDLVREMVRVAAGRAARLRPRAGASPRRVHRMPRLRRRSCVPGFMPSPGTLTALRAPGGPWVRDDSGFYSGAEVPGDYDPLISKLSVWGPDRPAAIARMRRALSEYVVTGIRHNLGFHERLLAHPEFVAGRYDTGFIEAHRSALLGVAEIPSADEEALAVAIAVAATRHESRTAEARSEGAPSAKELSSWTSQHRARTLR